MHADQFAIHPQRRAPRGQPQHTRRLAADQGGDEAGAHAADPFGVLVYDHSHAVSTLVVGRKRSREKKPRSAIAVGIFSSKAVRGQRPPKGSTCALREARLGAFEGQTYNPPPVSVRRRAMTLRAPY